MRLIESILADAAAITTLRRDIHAHPELCFQEQRTSDVIAKALTDWGIPVHRGLGTTGVVGIIKNGTSSRAVGLRADIDALRVATIMVDEGPSMKRIRPRAKGRADRILKRTAHITVVVSDAKAGR